MREVKTCDRCRHFKRRCDLVKPACSRCVQAGVRCSFDVERPSGQPTAGARGVAATARGPAVRGPAGRGPAAGSLGAVLATGGGAGTGPSALQPLHHQAPLPLPFPPLAAPPAMAPSMASSMASSLASTLPPVLCATPAQNLHALSSASPTLAAIEAGAHCHDPAATPAAGSNCSINGLISPTATTTASTESPEPSHLGDTTASTTAATPATTMTATTGPRGASQASAMDPAASSSSAAGAALPPSAPGSRASNGQRIVRKRKRNCLSCLRCHRLKVKCDKELPCGRCKMSGNGRECYYSYNKGPNGGKFPCPTAPVPSGRDDKKPQMATWQVQHRVRGSSHWRELMAKIGSLAASATGESSPLATALEGVGTNACLANFCLPGNFPFGTPGATKYFTRDVVARLVASERTNAVDYLRRYTELLDVVNPILDLPAFAEEIERYWTEPNSFSLCWLAQLCMVMGLGCFTTADEPPAATELMMAAEACLMQTPFMFRPTLMSLRALALMAVAKLVCNATCWSVDSAWTLMGLLVRVAFIFGLPQERGDNDEELRDPAERDARRRLWLTILYLDVKVSMCTGMPPLTRPDEVGALSSILPPAGTDLAQGHEQQGRCQAADARWAMSVPDNLHVVLYRSLPTVLAVLAQINLKKDPISYADVLRYNSQLRDLMAQAQLACSASLQRITVDIFLRRCLMVLHRPFALHPEGPVLYPESYWSSLECSLALLVHYRELWCPESGLRLDLVGRAFVLDFFSATLTTCVHMLRKDAPLSEAAASGCPIPPRQLILDTLRSCVEIWSGEQQKSVCWRTGYHLLRAVLALLPGTEQEHQAASSMAVQHGQ
ncbi:hypothetical protein CDD82_7426 [Ophiocordyceps australis]|uniref:Zn(2)-C6 fungal-type domain-containing protein n=1 Tax=Ophiocordyceps australis TaxID=1399860 RepID=A0A2C5YQD9_9HYPO|nr:hypothetical protein CDD82_7426 [Ophiocordyceps australis]